MNIMGIGVQEMIIILVGALLIFGPDRLPEVAGQMGKFLRDIRKMTGDLTGELERTAGVGDIKKAVQSELMGVKSTVEGATKGAQSTMKSAASSVSTAAKSATAAAAGKPASTTVSAASSAAKSTAKFASPSTSKTAATAAAAPKPVASKKDPRADVSFFEGSKAEKKPVVAAASNGATQAAAASAMESSTKIVTSVASPDQMDALARARQRRMTAGYNRRPS